MDNSSNPLAPNHLQHPITRRGRLLGHCARAAFWASPAVVSLGITYPTKAQAQAFSLSNYSYIARNSGLYYTNSNPTLYGGSSGAPWTLTNLGIVENSGSGSAVAMFSGTILNGGTIASASGAGVSIVNGGLVTNDLAGHISGGTGIVFGGSAASTLVNLGTVTGSVDYGVSLHSGGTITNSGTGALIYGAAFGVLSNNSAANVTNQGTIKSSAADGGVGIDLLDGGNVSNLGTASSIYGSGIGIVIGVSSGAGTILNQGTVSSKDEQAIYIGPAGGSVTNSGTDARIAAAHYPAIWLEGAGAVTNDGTIIDKAVNNNDWGAIELVAGGSVTNTGTGALISGAGQGIYAVGGSAAISNAGSIIGMAGDGVLLEDGGIITNTGTISGTVGVSFGGSADNTLITSGAIMGNTDAVEFGAGNDLLVLDPSAAMFGIVDGGGGSNTLELAGGSITGQLAGLGTGFVNFGTVVVESGADWIFSQSNSISAGGILTDAGSLTNISLLIISGALLVSGSLANNGSIAGEVTLTGPGAIDNTGQITSNAGAAIYGSGGAGHVTNSGTIIGSSSTGYGVKLLDGGTVTNSGTISGSYNAITILAAAGTFSNTGSITGTSFYGIRLNDGGSVTNTGTAAISGGSSGILIAGAAGTVTNDGSIGGRSGYGIRLNDGGNVTNTGTAVISGGGSGILFAGGAGTVINAGSIHGSANDGVFLDTGGSVTNSGVITGAKNGVYIDTGVAVVINTGTISGTGTSGVGVRFGSGAQGTIINYGMISGAGGTAVQFSDGSNELILENGSLLEGAANGGSGINTLVVEGSAQLANVDATGFQYVGFLNATQTIDVGSTISNAKIIAGTLNNDGTLNGNLSVGAATTLDNAGLLSISVASTNDGVITNSGSFANSSTLANNGTLTNGSVLTNTGLIDNAGLLINTGTLDGGGTLAGSGNVSNSGVIEGGAAGLVLTGGTLSNSSTGFIQGSQYGVQARNASVFNAGTIADNTTAGMALGTNAMLENQAGGVITGVTGLLFTGTGASTSNAGTITGTGGVAVQFDAAGGNALTLDTGAVLNGSINGGGGANDVTLAGTGNMANTVTDFGAGSSLAVTGDWVVNGAVTIPAIAVASGASLSGNGSFTGALTNAGVLAPGGAGSIGTIRVTGSYTQGSSGTLEITLNAGAASLLAVSGAAELAGGLLLDPISGNVAGGTRYTIVTASSGVSGVFASISTASPLLAPTVTYDADDAFVTIGQLAVTTGLGNIGGTPNQMAVAAAFDAANTENPAGFAPALDHLDTLSDAGLHAALGDMSGEVYSGLASAAFASADLFAGQIERQGQMFGDSGGAQAASALNAGSRVQLAGQGNLSVWFSGYGQSTDISGDGNAHDFDSTIGGGVVGLDDTIRPDLRIGAALGAASTSLGISGTGGHAQLTQTQVAVYADYAPDAPYYLDGLAGFAYGAGHVYRGLDLAGNGQASAYVADKQYFGALEAGYAFPLTQAMQLTPFLQLAADLVDQNGSHESGGGTLDLSTQSRDTGSLQSQLGARFTGSLPLGSRSLTTMLSAGWAHEYLPSNRVAVLGFSAAPGASFQVDGAQPARDAADISVGLATAIFANANLYVTYDGSFSGTTTAHAVSGGLRVNW